MLNGANFVFSLGAEDEILIKTDKLTAQHFNSDTSTNWPIKIIQIKNDSWHMAPKFQLAVDKWP